ncbi:VOC family protein [Thermomonospora cellulosilytica]|uniref:Putative enzyme related to lactoylglutathione lyase n=1 Tax=Thermomonospora cellulosilytica TaxID=1411118 RepID=A0A7W3MU96_9ACTN|nr:VOC family protein [Thermomonospora cellulosilytica]MBA9001984.1 putative enzyme related to lactoylglutathione lyase [Thermomonospora cellulosilytica]
MRPHPQAHAFFLEMTMSMPPYGSVAWFEIATDDPDAAQRFYGEVFGWQVAADPQAGEAGTDYRLITTAGGDAPAGGILGTGGTMPGHAVFSVAVRDVQEVCASVERLGGTVVARHEASEGGPANAYLRDPSGNLFGVFSPPAEA